MKTKYIIYPVTLLFMLWVPILRYYSSTPNDSACVLDYVDEFQNSNYEWYMYNIDGIRHIEAKSSPLTKSLKPYLIGESKGCMMFSDNLFSDINNTFYCSITYLIRNAPIHEKLKQPLGIKKDTP